MYVWSTTICNVIHSNNDVSYKLMGGGSIVSGFDFL